MEQAQRRLLLMRHGHAADTADTAAGDGGDSDHDRALSPRGRRDAHAAGARLAQRGDVPALVLVSTALRTRETWAAVRAGLGQTSAEAWFDRALYDAGPAAVVELLAAVEDEVAVVLVIGHNPAMSVVAAAVSDGQGDPVLEERVAEGLSTSAVACFDVPVAWADVNARTLRLTEVDPGAGAG